MNSGKLFFGRSLDDDSLDFIKAHVITSAVVQARRAR
jgi:hypothetical protein